MAELPGGDEIGAAPGDGGAGAVADDGGRHGDGEALGDGVDLGGEVRIGFQSVCFGGQEAGEGEPWIALSRHHLANGRRQAAGSRWKRRERGGSRYRGRGDQYRRARSRRRVGKQVVVIEGVVDGGHPRDRQIEGNADDLAREWRRPRPRYRPERTRPTLRTVRRIWREWYPVASACSH